MRGSVNLLHFLYDDYFRSNRVVTRRVFEKYMFSIILQLTRYLVDIYVRIRSGIIKIKRENGYVECGKK